MVDLPLVPVMAKNGASRRTAGALAAEELDVADHLDPGSARVVHGPVRLGMGERHAGRQDQGGEARPVAGREIHDVSARRGRAVPRGGRSRPKPRPRRRRPAAPGRWRSPSRPSPKSATLAPGKGGDRRHRHRTFRVARPSRARPKAMIQNRMTICDSDQPSCSK